MKPVPHPYGLQMAGISDKALGKLESKNKFNGGVELEEDYGVNLYSTFYRQYDPQIGRFGGVDVLSEKTAGMSVYQFSNNNPISFNDPSGALSALDWNDFISRLDGMDFGDYGGTYSSGGGGGGGGGGGFTAFGSQDQAFMYGAMQVNGAWRGSGGGRSGMASSFEDALNRYNGGRITTGMAQEYQSVTWGAQANNVTASSAEGGFNVGLTASSSGNSYSVFVSTQSIKDGLDFLQDLYRSNNGKEDGTNWSESPGYKIASVTDNAIDLTQATVVWSQQLANKVAKTNYEVIDVVKDSHVLSTVGNVLGVVSIVDHGSKFLNDPSGHWVDGVEAVGQGLVMAFGGEEVEIAWNVGSMICDWARDAMDDQ